MIVYRKVPVMAMARLPTKASHGKANLHRGARGVGIDMTTGKTLGAIQGSTVITHHPDTGIPVRGIAVLEWRTLLIMAAKPADMSGLGY